ncbi:MAG: hypothetical protein ACR2NP_11005, partial [Pirellulaceae bacterium]
RQGHLAVRNAELQLVREKTLMREQQRQLLLDLNAAYAEVDRSFLAIKNNYNNRAAVLDELRPKRRRVEAGDEQIFFLLDAQRRAAVIESQFHRAVVDYNLALQNFVYTSGGLLEYYNVRLMEGDWLPEAQMQAGEKGSRFRFGPANPAGMAVCPISDGSVDQDTDTMLESEMASGFDEIAPDAAPELDIEQR